MEEMISRTCATCGSRCNYKDGVFVCQNCGNVYVKVNSNNKLLADLSVAQSYRQNAEFSKAQKIYNDVISHNKTADLSEAFWGLFLCDFNVVFEFNEKDVAFPSFYSMKTESVYEAESYKTAIAYIGKTSPLKASSYKKIASEIESARKNYIEIEKNNQPYDLFICFKDLVPDNMTARELYNHLSSKYRVFFSPISLNNVKGNFREYEPNIYYALYTSKVMLVVCSNNKNVTSQWVKNEWSRFSDIASGSKKSIIPIFSNGYQPNMLPSGLSKYQGLFDGRSLIADLEKNLQGIFENGNKEDAPKRDNHSSREKRAEIELSSGNFEKAKALYDEILNDYPESGNAWWGLFLAEQKLKNEDKIIDPSNSTIYSVYDNTNYKNALRFADDNLRERIKALNNKAEQMVEDVYLYIKNGRYPGAKRLCKKILSVCPTDINIWWLLLCLNFEWDGKDVKKGVEIGSKKIEESKEYQAILKYDSQSGGKYKSILGQIKKHEQINEFERAREEKLEEAKKELEKQSAEKEIVVPPPASQTVEKEVKIRREEVRKQYIHNTITTHKKSNFFKKALLIGSITTVLILSFTLVTFVFLKGLNNGVFRYTLQEDDTYCVTGYLSLGKSNEIEIPSEYHDKKVTAIADNVFKNKTKIEEITLPDTIKYIGKDAFYGTGYYNELTNWEGETLYIGNYLINSKTTLLNSFSFKKGVTLIADYAFENCTNLANVTLPSTVESVGKYAFSGCTSLTDFAFSTSTKYIGEGVFSGDTMLENVIVPNENLYYTTENNVLYNKDKSILLAYPSGCEDKSFTLLDSVKRIAERAFYHAQYIKNLHFGENSHLLEIEESAFNNCLALKSLSLPNGVTQIGKYAFANCVALQSVLISSKVEKIGTSAFSSCNQLLDVYIDSYEVASNFTSSTSQGSICSQKDTDVYVNTKIGANNVGAYLSKKYQMDTNIHTVNGETYYKYGYKR